MSVTVTVTQVQWFFAISKMPNAAKEVFLLQISLGFSGMKKGLCDKPVFPCQTAKSIHHFKSTIIQTFTITFAQKAPFSVQDQTQTPFISSRITFTYHGRWNKTIIPLPVYTIPGFIRTPIKAIIMWKGEITFLCVTVVDI